MHRARVDVDVFEPDGRILARDARDGLAPESRSLKHVRLIDGSHEAATRHRRLERDARDSLYLADRVAHRVEGRRRVALAAEAARLAEVHTAEKLDRKG